ncbi:TonB-dependent receptor [Maribellus maritimus]|uniref:TonB-dependent receptor n=1 Tax=Maribellus maritimus TaxID=2870838 RepID=UPI001EE9F6AD|nr:TonB-dependent receptor [Maribellus maritimus]MCG6186189.1 TonB-dependent receptor [Maribellus maritimus]
MKKRSNRAVFERPLKKLLLKMKLTFAIFLLGLVSVSASTYSQNTRLDISFNNNNIVDLFKEIENKSEFYFFYQREDLKKIENVSVNVEDATVMEILDQVLSGTSLDYKIVDRYIIVRQKESNFGDAIIRGEQQKPVNGTVKDKNGMPLPGVTVLEKGTGNGTVTNTNGEYSLSVNANDAILLFSFVGMQSQEIPVEGKRQIDVVLEEGVIGLEEVVAIGYGTMKKRDVTGSVSSADGSELVKVNSSSVSTAISGRLPGLHVSQSSGSAGAGSVLRIRGVGSVYSGVDPLVIIDGFQGDINQVSPNDVETITVLKDAASASIYGARAANGVILITTKTGKRNQELKVNVNVKYGTQQATNIPKLLDSEDWCRKMNESTLARTGTQYWVGDQAPELQTTNTDWFDYIFRSAPVQDYNLSATGGSKNLQYAVNINYYNQDGIMIGENYQRASARSNIEFVTERFSAGLRTYHYKTWSSNHSADINGAMFTPPTIPLYNEDGLPGTPREGTGEDQLQNNTPVMSYNSVDNSAKANSTTVNLYSELKLWDGLKFKTVFNISGYDSYREDFRPEWFTYRPEDTDHSAPYRHQSPASLTVYDNTSSIWEWQNLLTYVKDYKKHHFDILAGISAQKSESAYMSAYRNTFPRNSLVAINAGSEDYNNSGSSGEGSLSSQFGRINYSFDNKYLLQMNVRRDGSSVFAPKNRWGVFPSASFGWRISEESFLKDNSVISNMKLRAGIGSLGNSNIPSYKWLSSISFGAGYVFGEEQALNSGATVSGAYNEDITWEKTTTTNIALDLGLFNNQFNMTLDVFKRKTTDMLLILPLPSTTGYSSDPYVNIGGVDNSGWEFTAQYINRSHELKYDISFNITHVKNKVVDMGDVAPIIDLYTRTEEGQSINSYYGYVVEGIYQSEADIAASPTLDGARPGDFKYKDLDNSGTIDEDDRKFLGNSIPEFYYGGNVNLEWKNLDMSIQLQGEFGKNIMVTPEFAMDFGTLYDYTNMYQEVYDNRWTQEGDDSYYPAIGSGIRGINNVCNTRWLMDASYLRVKNLQIGYTLPNQLLSGIPINKIRVFLSGTNLLTFTDYVGFDPEIGVRQKRSDSTGYIDMVYTRGGSNTPQARTFQAGVTITF